MSMRRADAQVKLPEPTKTFDFAESSLKPIATEPVATESNATDLKWSDLTETEKAAASLGVDASEWKPLAFMNDAHYNELLRTNALDGDLARRLEAYKAVAAADAK